MQINEEHIISLLIDYCKGELSAEQKAEVNQIMKDPESKKEFLKYYKLYKNSRSIAFVNDLDKEIAWGKINSGICRVKSISKPKKIRKLIAWIPYAAAVTIFAIVGTYLIQDSLNREDYTADYNFEELVDVDRGKAVLKMADGSLVDLEENKSIALSEVDGTKIYKDSANNISYQKNNVQASEAIQPKILYNTVIVPRGGEYQLTLTDGTKVILNSESELRYPTQFEKNKREVYLVGEAYFDVAHNKSAPFKVYSHDNTVEVLGTKFNVSAYEDQEFIATTLVEGSVQIEHLGNSEILEPGYQSMVVRGREEIDVKAVDVSIYTSWIHGVYEFENTELEYIMAQLSRWYNVRIFFEEEDYKGIRFTGAIKREDSFNFALEMIGKIADVDFAIKDGYVLVGKE